MIRITPRAIAKYARCPNCGRLVLPLIVARAGPRPTCSGCSKKAAS